MQAVARVLGLALVIASCWPLTAAAAPADELAKARDAFRAGDYVSTIPVLSSLLYPRARLADTAQLAEAHLLLGVSYFETGDPQSASREFEEALFLNSELSLDPLLFSDKVVGFFDERQQAIEQQKKRDDEARQLAEERDRLQKALDNMVVIEKRDYYVNFIPFGAGQFQNGDRGKGYFFFVSELATTGASATLFFYLLTKYRLQDDIPLEEVQKVRNLQIVQVSLGATAIGLMVVGILDSLRNYQPNITRKPDKKFIDVGPGSTDTAPSSSFRIVPMVTPDNLGVAASWEF